MSRTQIIGVAVLILVFVGMLSLVGEDIFAWAKHAGPVIDEVRVEIVDETFEFETQAGEMHVDRKLIIRGRGFFGSAFGPQVFVLQPDGQRVASPRVLLQDEYTIIAYPPEGSHGRVHVTVQNPDRQTAGWWVVL